MFVPPPPGEANRAPPPRSEARVEREERAPYRQGLEEEEGRKQEEAQQARSRTLRPRKRNSRSQGSRIKNKQIKINTFFGCLQRS